ncbi:MAG: aminotransferase class V-fold PLP-dependent enzyme [Verrucomicrobiota bacterium]|nr:aminotransferase class V-fold PLP-dependent enzyme [Verrucomicrobiota bacterium]MDE3067953.1 aminotransferase class V-fold PLP-dependent enzyme [Verrucomicrobiota bacterium]
MNPSLPAWLRDEASRRREFPVARDKIFLAHAGVCPLPRRVAEAIAGCAQRGATDDQETLALPRSLSDARRLAARLLNCQPDEIALVGPTSLALSFVAAGLEFQPGDNVLVYQDDYPSNVYPWMALAARGVEVRRLRAPGLGVIRPDDVLGRVDGRTRLVALASCHFISGWRLDFATIGKGLRERGILFCLDAIQTLGAFPTTVEHVDFLAADAHKWLLGPCGAGLFYVRREVQEKLNPPIYGWHNVRCPDFVAQDQIVFSGGAKKFEAGTQNLVGLAGLVAALELAQDVGVENIAGELRRQRAWLAPALQTRDFTVLNADAAPENTGGILSFFKSGANAAALQKKLQDAGVVASLRADRAGQKYIRLSPHYYNTDAELRRALDALEA